MSTTLCVHTNASNTRVTPAWCLRCSSRTCTTFSSTASSAHSLFGTSDPSYSRLVKALADVRETVFKTWTRVVELSSSSYYCWINICVFASFRWLQRWWNWKAWVWFMQTWSLRTSCWSTPSDSPTGWRSLTLALRVMCPKLSAQPTYSPVTTGLCVLFFLKIQIHFPYYVVRMDFNSVFSVLVLKYSVCCPGLQKSFWACHFVKPLICGLWAVWLLSCFWAGLSTQEPLSMTRSVLTLMCYAFCLGMKRCFKAALWVRTESASRLWKYCRCSVETLSAASNAKNQR